MSAAVKITQTEHTASDLCGFAARRRDATQSRRLLAMAMVLDTERCAAKRGLQPGQKRSCGHAQCHVPAMPRSGFAVIEAKLFLGALEARFDDPAQSSSASQFRQRCSGACEDQIGACSEALRRLRRISSRCSNPVSALPSAIRVHSYSCGPFDPSPAACCVQASGGNASASVRGSVCSRPSFVTKRSV